MKKFMMLMATVMVAMVMNAHTTEQKFFDNTYISIRGGMTALTQPNNNGYGNYGHSFEAATALQIGKWITPKIGIAIDGTNGWTNGSKYGNFQSDYAVNYITVAALAKYRIPIGMFNFVAAAGPSWIHGFNKHAADGNDIGTKFQIEVNWDLNKYIQFNLVPEWNYNFTANVGNQPKFNAKTSWHGLMAGVTYKFNDGFKTCDKLYTQADMDAINEKINEARSKVKTEVVEKVVEKVIYKADEYVVFFDNNSATLSESAMKTLDKVTGNVIVKGGASENGSTERNQELSKERAQVVANYLRNKGVNVIDAVGLGVTGNRTAIITVQ